MRLPACIHVVSLALSELNTRAALLCFEYAIPIRSLTLVRLLTLNSTSHYSHRSRNPRSCRQYRRRSLRRGRLSYSPSKEARPADSILCIYTLDYGYHTLLRIYLAEGWKIKTSP